MLDKPVLLHWFLENGAYPNAECEIGISPFMVAASVASLDVVKLFYEYGARPENPLTSAAKRLVKGQVEVVRFLLDVGAEIDAIEFQHNAYGSMSGFNMGAALNIACGRQTEEHEEIVELLLKRGARTDVLDFMWRRAVDVARQFGTEKMVEMLEGRRNE